MLLWSSLLVFHKIFIRSWRYEFIILHNNAIFVPNRGTKDNLIHFWRHFSFHIWPLCFWLREVTGCLKKGVRNGKNMVPSHHMADTSHGRYPHITWQIHHMAGTLTSQVHSKLKVQGIFLTWAYTYIYIYIYIYNIYFQTRAQNLLVRRIVKHPWFMYFSKSSAGRSSSMRSISWRYSWADFAYGRWTAAWNMCNISRTLTMWRSQSPVRSAQMKRRSVITRSTSWIHSLAVRPSFRAFSISCSRMWATWNTSLVERASSRAIFSWRSHNTMHGGWPQHQLDLIHQEQKVEPMLSLEH